MIKIDETGRGLLVQEVTGIIRRIPIEKRGVSKRNVPWVLGGVLLEAYEDGVEGSVPLYLTTWDEAMVEFINRLGVGKHVRARFHIESKEYYDNYRVSVIVDEIDGLTEAESFAYGKRTKKEQFETHEQNG